MDKMHECFVIAPIGPPGSDVRDRTESLVEFIIKKAAQDHYEVTIAHLLPDPGKITVQVIEKIVSSALVIADLTDRNANVFYELSLRHVLNEPAILMVQEDQLDQVPFDVKDLRITPYNLQKIKQNDHTIAELRDQILLIEKNEKMSTGALSDNISVFSKPQGPASNVTLLGTLLIANRFRYELIEPFFDYLYGGSFEDRLAKLHVVFRSVMRESARREWLSREKILSAFTNTERRQKVDGIFRDVAEIIPKLVDAMSRKDEPGVEESLRLWRVNNARFFQIWSREYSEWLEIELSNIEGP